MIKFPSSFLSLAFLTLSLNGAYALDCEKGQLRLKEGTLVDNSSCENIYLSEVASSYGLKVSPSELNNPNKKKDICRSVWTDNRVNMICERAGIPERY